MNTKIDIDLLPRPVNHIGIERWTEETQKKLYSVFSSQKSSPMITAHRIVKLFVNTIRASVLFAIAAFILTFLIVNQMGGESRSTLIEVGAYIILSLCITLTIGGMFLLLKMEKAGDEDFKALSRMRKNIFEDWSAPYRYEYSLVFWYFQRERIELSRQKRDALMDYVQTLGEADNLPRM